MVVGNKDKRGRKKEKKKKGVLEDFLLFSFLLFSWFLMILKKSPCDQLLELKFLKLLLINQNVYFIAD